MNFLKQIRQAALGDGNLSTTVSGVGAILVVAGSFMMNGTVDTEALGLAAGFLGIGQIVARGGGTGSDAAK